MTRPASRTNLQLAVGIHLGVDQGDITAREPHELTHAPDAIRYFAAGRPAPGSVDEPEEEPDFDRQADDFLHYSGR